MRNLPGKSRRAANDEKYSLVYRTCGLSVLIPDQILHNCIPFQMDRSRLFTYKEGVQCLVKKASANEERPICARCILRYCNVKQVFNSGNCSYDEVIADLISLLPEEVSSQIAPKLKGFCSSCLNVLNDDFAAEASCQIHNKIKEEGFDAVEDFQLQIHLPIILTLRNNYFQKKFNMDDDEIIGIKELFKVFLAAKLSKLMGVKNNQESSFVIGKLSRLYSYIPYLFDLSFQKSHLPM